MNGAAKQKPQTPPQRLRTQGSPQIQGSLTERWRWVSGQQTRSNPPIQDDTSEPSLIKGLFIEEPSLKDGLCIVRFAGRMRRREFWLSQFYLGPCWLLLLLCFPLLGGLETVAALVGAYVQDVPPVFLILFFLLDGYFSLVSLGMQVRRLHDIGISGWTYLLGIIICFLAHILGVWSGFTLKSSIMLVIGCFILPALGLIILTVLFCRDSQYGANRWGPNPKGQGNTQKTEGAEKYRLTAEQEAAEKYHLAAEQGDAHAQNNLGECYYYGNGVDKNYAEAVKWYRLAAEQGDAHAQNNLGVCYYYGHGVDRNYAEAVKWYRIAAGQGFTDAQYNLGVCYANGDGASKNPTEAAKWYRRAADSGDRDAMYELGKCYLDGIGTEKAEEQAKYWLQIAADNGNTDASELLHLTRTFN